MNIPLRHNKSTNTPTELPEARENASDQDVIGFSFTSDWYREWCGFMGRLYGRGKAKTKQSRTVCSKNCDFDYGHPKVKQPKRCKIANLKP